MPAQREEDEAEIRQQVDKIVAGIRARDLEGLKRLYATDVVSFDVEPPLQHVGIEAKLKNWAKAFTFFASSCCSTSSGFVRGTPTTSSFVGSRSVSAGAAVTGVGAEARGDAIGGSAAGSVPVVCVAGRGAVSATVDCTGETPIWLLPL